MFKYGGKEVSTGTYTNNPNPHLAGEEVYITTTHRFSNDSTQAHFSVYDVFAPVELQVFEDKVAVKGPRPSR